MKIATASGRLAALGNETRLAIFRLLMQAETEGVSASATCEKNAAARSIFLLNPFHVAFFEKSPVTGMEAIFGRRYG